MGEWFSDKDIDGIPLIVSRTGWSSELGYELNIKVLPRDVKATIVEKPFNDPKNKLSKT